MTSPSHYGYSDVPASWNAPSGDAQIPVPADKHPLTVCTITGLVGQAVGDYSSDVDQVPEVETLNGTGTIVPKEPFTFAPHFVDGPLTIKMRNVTFEVVNGRIESNGTEGVTVLAGDEYTQPQSIPYVIKLSVHDDNDEPVVLPDIEFNATEGTVDYTMLSPIPATPPANTVRGPAGSSFSGLLWTGTHFVASVTDANGVVTQLPPIPFDGELSEVGEGSVTTIMLGDGIVTAEKLHSSVIARLDGNKTYVHEQNNPAVEWVVDHGLPQPISAVDIVANGEHVEVGWDPTGPGQITIYFAGLCSGTARIS